MTSNSTALLVLTGALLLPLIGSKRTVSRFHATESVHDAEVSRHNNTAADTAQTGGCTGGKRMRVCGAPDNCYCCGDICPNSLRISPEFASYPVDSNPCDGPQSIRMYGKRCIDPASLGMTAAEAEAHGSALLSKARCPSLRYCGVADVAGVEPCISCTGACPACYEDGSACQGGVDVSTQPYWVMCPASWV
eukprot:gnl/MRDRNA2_/MRDRNA2_150862_c0_seq1.p1 gnl/MRDRNA2_/MRDRNA2_150862_c0~~gnl/MRDRNA2_/MRDRNA2_150862_c0_seq1.p1  ORF type:complete len:224 (+),score=11.88 gnl/MRDRNA2_/MRDRNA2_150862_c0_seq1:97-672(+)